MANAIYVERVTDHVPDPRTTPRYDIHFNDKEEFPGKHMACRCELNPIREWATLTRIAGGYRVEGRLGASILFRFTAKDEEDARLRAWAAMTALGYDFEPGDVTDSFYCEYTLLDKIKDTAKAIASKLKEAADEQ